MPEQVRTRVAWLWQGQEKMTLLRQVIPEKRCDLDGEWEEYSDFENYRRTHQVAAFTREELAGFLAGGIKALGRME